MAPPPANSRRSVLQGVFIGPAASTVLRVNLTPKTGGWPLPRDVRAKMESALGANFSDVRIHVGPEANALGAIAFTWGSDIHFAPGQYNPHTPHGQSLLGHELAHVVQQRAGRVSNPFGGGVAVVRDRALEAEADRLGRQAAMSHKPAGAAPSPASVRPGAPPVYRPNAAPPLQRKAGIAAPPVYRPQPAFPQPRAAVCQPKYRSKGRLATRGWYTQTGKYFIAANNPHKLYSYWGADPPQPVSLYTKSWDWLSGMLWSSWTPKVKFLSQKNAWETGEPYSEYASAVGGHQQGSFIFGKNDCANFAAALSSQISHEFGVPEKPTVKVKGQASLARVNGVGVGTYLKHALPNRTDCNYHAATVVAVDGKDLVTLEADVSRPLLVPSFEIRTGVLGFVRDNDPEMEFGQDEVSVGVMGSQTIVTARDYASHLKPGDDNLTEFLLTRGLVAL